MDGHRSNSMVIRLKVDFPNESKDKRERLGSVKVDGLKIFGLATKMNVVQNYCCPEMTVISYTFAND